MATINLGNIKFNWKGTYNAGTAYAIDDVVSYNGSSYVCILASTGNLPTNTTYWNVMSEAGTDGTDLTTTLTTQGDLVYRDGSGLQRLGAGTSGQFLKTQGTGANPTWADLASNYVKIAETNVTTALTAVTFNAVFSGSDYHVYHLYHNDVRLGTSGAELYLRLRRSNADISSASYDWFTNLGYHNGSSAGHTYSVGRGSDYARASGQDYSGSSGDHANSGTSTFVNPTKSAHPSGGTAVSNWKYFYNHGFQMGHGGTNNTIRPYQGGGILKDSGAVDGFTMYASSGNIEAGNFVLYGVKR
tara:strand:+ start:1247 stop:2149 length:903 start_codon:yes stop_codon:yes gene_type:complete